jgi:hypothetical protein
VALASSGVSALERNLITSTIDAAVSRANRGDVAGGHDGLMHGLQRAQAARDDGEAWVAELAEQGQQALERHARVYWIGRAFFGSGSGRLALLLPAVVTLPSRWFCWLLAVGNIALSVIIVTLYV